MVTEETYIRVALEDPDGQWELAHGCLRQKPAMSIAHNRQGRLLTRMLIAQLDEEEFDVIENMGRVRRSARNYYIPDVYVVPMAWVRELLTTPETLEVYREPLPLIVEVWSPSTGAYDVGDKLAEYKRRGDLEIWSLHPYKRTLTVWQRQADGSYTESVYSGGIIRPAFLPDVAVDLDAIFA